MIFRVMASILGALIISASLFFVLAKSLPFDQPVGEPVQDEAPELRQTYNECITFTADPPVTYCGRLDGHDWGAYLSIVDYPWADIRPESGLNRRIIISNSGQFRAEQPEASAYLEEDIEPVVDFKPPLSGSEIAHGFGICGHMRIEPNWPEGVDETNHPELMQEGGIGVHLSFDVSEDGQPFNIEAADSDPGNAPFVQAAIQGLANMCFEPAKPPARQTAIIRFQLEN